MSFTKEGHVHVFQGLQAGSPEISSSWSTEKLLKKDHTSIIAKFNSIQVIELKGAFYSLVRG